MDQKTDLATLPIADEAAFDSYSDQYQEEFLLDTSGGSLLMASSRVSPDVLSRWKRYLSSGSRIRQYIIYGIYDELPSTACYLMKSTESFPSRERQRSEFFGNGLIHARQKRQTSKQTSTAAESRKLHQIRSDSISKSNICLEISLSQIEYIISIRSRIK